MSHDDKSPRGATPRTDAECWCPIGHTQWVVSENFAKQLERELAGMTADRDLMVGLYNDAAKAANAPRPSLGTLGGELLRRLQEIASSRRNLKFAITEQERCVDLKGDLQLATARAKQNMEDAYFSLIDTEDPDFDLDKALASLSRSPLAAQDAVGKFAIDVEKMLCRVLGREWSAAGISVNSLVNDIQARLSHTATINQCDGCQRGLPLREGKYHDLTGEVGCYPGEVISCTADRYAQPSATATTGEKK